MARQQQYRDGEQRTTQNGEQRVTRDGEQRVRRGGPSGLKARDVMSADPALCTPGTPLKKVAKLMTELNCGAIPVVEGLDSKIPVGIVTDRDIVTRVVAQGLNPLELSAIDCMSAPVITVAPDDDVENIIYMLEQAQVRRLVVVDERGGVIGVVAQADLVLSQPDLGLELVESVSLPREEEMPHAREGGPGSFG